MHSGPEWAKIEQNPKEPFFRVILYVNRGFLGQGIRIRKKKLNCARVTRVRTKKRANLTKTMIKPFLGGYFICK